MKFLSIAVVVVLAGIQGLHAQLNAYSYVVVPRTLQEFEHENQYHTSTLLKYLLSENNFAAYYEGDVPEALQDKCQGLRIDMLDESNMFRTKVFLVMKDCEGREVFRTMEGSSRAKELKDGYDEALRSAFKSIAALDYHYEPGAHKGQTLTLPFKNDIKEMENPGDLKPGNPNRANDPAVTEVATPEEQRYEDKRPKPSEFVAAVAAPESPPIGKGASGDKDIWFAQTLPHGFQLVDRSPKIRLTLQETSLPEVYLAENETTRGLVYKKGSRWFYEYYRDGQAVVQELYLRF